MAEAEHELTFQFKHKTYGQSAQVETSRLWIQRQMRAIMHNPDFVLELVEDEVSQTEVLPGFEGV